jgi:predicted dithiol-disulfide oxidoreductase (DUF899 family)
MGMTQPQIVSREAWRAAHERLLAKEKALTRASDALAAERRRMPMVEMDPAHRFAGPHGPVTLADLFEGRRQLILYAFMFPPGGPPCDGCSFFVDQIGHPAHLHARDTTIALMSRASLEEIDGHRRRMGWTIPWYSLAGNERFYAELGIGAGFALTVFLRHDGRVLHSYTTTGRGVEALGSAWSLLDRTPLGRQETWEDSPDWVEQTPPYVWWRLHDSYDTAALRAS